MENSKDICSFTLLYFDNDATTREAVGRIIYKNQPSIRLLFAESRKDALAKTKEHQPDIFIINLGVLLLEGARLCQEILKSSGYRPVIILSGYGDEEMVAGLLKTGVADYIVRPVNADLLLAKLNDILQGLFVGRLIRAQAIKSAVCLE